MNRMDKMKIIADWVGRCFGPAFLNDTKERVSRLLEETTELAQAEGLDHASATKILNEVYGRPLPGDPMQEAGGVAVTFLAYCESKKWHPGTVEMVEIRRILSKPDAHFRNRQQQKSEQGTGMYPTVERK